MFDNDTDKGFSLLEIFVSLFIVSLTAVEVIGLQQMVSSQNRDNFIYSEVLRLAAEKMETVLQFPLVTDIDALDGLEETRMTAQANTKLNLQWDITKPTSAYNAGVNIRNVGLQVSWNNSKQVRQEFTYNGQINLIRQSNIDSTGSVEIVESVFKNKEAIYFEPKMDYKKGAFIIFNSELFEATAAHLAGSGFPIKIDTPAVISEGWKSYGLIDNPALADNAALEVLFVN